MRAAVFFAALFSASLALASEVSFVEWRDLSDCDLSPEGKTALNQKAGTWRHTESDHFIYHVTDPKAARTVLDGAEVYYEWVKNIFGVSEDSWKKKCHIFVFEDKKDWADFHLRLNESLEGDAFTNGSELFIYRNPYWLSPKKTLAHEVTHLVVYRFLEGRIPLSLNEGIAEHIGYKAAALQADGNEFSIRTVKFIPEAEWIPAEDLIRMSRYPEKGRLETFYRESELLVRYLIHYYKGRDFYAFLMEVSQGTPVEGAINRIYGLDWTAFQEKFKTFALTGK